MIVDWVRQVQPRPTEHTQTVAEAKAIEAAGGESRRPGAVRWAHSPRRVAGVESQRRNLSDGLTGWASSTLARSRRDRTSVFRAYQQPRGAGPRPRVQQEERTVATAWGAWPRCERRLSKTWQRARAPTKEVSFFKVKNHHDRKISRGRWVGSGKLARPCEHRDPRRLPTIPWYGARFGGRARNNPERSWLPACRGFRWRCVRGDKAGFATTEATTHARVRLAKEGDGFVIDRIALELSAAVPGIGEAQFHEIAQTAKRNCPLSKALAAVPEITLEASLLGE